MSALVGEHVAGLVEPHLVETKDVARIGHTSSFHQLSGDAPSLINPRYRRDRRDFELQNRERTKRTLNHLSQGDGGGPSSSGFHFGGAGQGGDNLRPRWGDGCLR